MRRIVSGGQTGADRGGLDAARALGIDHGGWCPRGRRAEDGPVPRKYRLDETPTAVYRERSERNVRAADATVLFTRGAAVGGSRITLAAARALRKPRLHLDLAAIAADEERQRRRLRAWLKRHRVRVLNVAGARESQAPGAQAAVRRFLIGALRAAAGGYAKVKSNRASSTLEGGSSGRATNPAGCRLPTLTHARPR